MESAQAKRAEVDVPLAVVDLDEPDIFLAQRLTDVDPLLVPADPAVATDAADLRLEPFHRSDVSLGYPRQALRESLYTHIRADRGPQRRGGDLGSLPSTGEVVGLIRQRVPTRADPTGNLRAGEGP